MDILAYLHVHQRHDGLDVAPVHQRLLAQGLHLQRILSPRGQVRDRELLCSPPTTVQPCIPAEKKGQAQIEGLAGVPTESGTSMTSHDTARQTPRWWDEPTIRAL